MMIPMMADCTDYELYRSGRYVPGMVATVYSFVDKLISSFATTIVGIFVAAIGYTSTTPQIGDELTTGIFIVTMFLYNGMPILGWGVHYFDEILSSGRGEDAGDRGSYRESKREKCSVKYSRRRTEMREKTGM